MALPIWGIYMKKCYANEDLGVSKDAFIAPENDTIKMSCKEEKKPVLKTILRLIFR